LRVLKKGGDVPRLKPADIIVAVADVNNPTYSDMRQLTTANEGRTLPVTVLRSEPNGLLRRLTVPVVPRKEADSDRVVIGLALEFDVEHPIVTKTLATERHPRPIAIPAGATITAVDGVEVSSFYDIARQVRQNAGRRPRIDWRLDERTAGNVAIDAAGISQSGMVAVDVFLEQPVPFADLERLYKADGPIDAVEMGYKRTKTFIIQTYVTLQRLIGGLVSPKQLMGPVGILTFSYRIVAAQPIIYYFLGLISASIAVLNFLPLPPLDGGLTLLLLVEKIKGSAISVRTQEIIAYMGWGLVGALLLYVTFNDITRSFLG
jgi:regulator of sigma E protease